MTILQSLNGYYARMAERGEAEPTGFSREKISYRILLSDDGDVADVVPLFETVGKKRVPRMLNVPAAVIRKSNILPNLLWDKTAYSLGRTAGEGRRTAEEHAAFKAANLAVHRQQRRPGPERAEGIPGKLAAGPLRRGPVRRHYAGRQSGFRPGWRWAGSARAPCCAS